MILLDSIKRMAATYLIIPGETEAYAGLSPEGDDIHPIPGGFQPGYCCQKVPHRPAGDIRHRTRVRNHYLKKIPP